MPYILGTVEPSLGWRASVSFRRMRLWSCPSPQPASFTHARGRHKLIILLLTLSQSDRADTIFSSCNTTNSHLILTPPQSGDESSSTVTNPSSSSYSYASLPKVSVSNASGSEYYSSGAYNFLRPTFNGTSMTQIDGRGAPMQM